MSLEPCAVCPRPGSVGNEWLRMTLCHAHDQLFLAWYATSDLGVNANDWPGLVRGAVA